MAAKIIWSEIDEAPALATYAFLPVVQAFTKGTGIEVETRDISLSGRVLAAFPERLKPEQQVADYLDPRTHHPIHVAAGVLFGAFFALAFT